jgi:hypothetical protein
MKPNKSFKDLTSMLRQSFDQVKTKEIIEENKQEVMSFFGQTGEKIN